MPNGYYFILSLILSFVLYYQILFVNCVLFFSGRWVYVHLITI
jgi:hypothetical protein